MFAFYSPLSVEKRTLFVTLNPSLFVTLSDAKGLALLLRAGSVKGLVFLKKRSFAEFTLSQKKEFLPLRIAQGQND
jgi:hypothetical protein